MLNLQLCPSHVAIQNPRLFSNHQISSQSSITPTNSSSNFNNRSFITQSSNKKSSLKCQSDYFGGQQQQKFTTPKFSSDSSFSSSPPGGGGGGATLPPRVYVGHSIYKGKSALTVEPKAPEFASLDSGAFKIAKEGFVLLQFAPAAGVRQYDWSRKQVFSLSVAEIGTIISLGAKDSCDFFHDPFKGRSDEGKVRKVLKVEPLPDGTGYFFNLNVQNKLLNMDESIYIPITKAEFAVLISAFNFILPHLLGWHAFANSIRPEDATRSNNTSPKSADYEWSR